MKYNMFYGLMPKKGLIMETSRDIQGMRKDVAQIKNELNGMAKMIPSILKANGVSMNFDIFGFDAPVGVVESVASALRLMRMSDKLIEHWINTVEETDKKLSRIEEHVEYIEKRNEKQFEMIMKSLRELKELYNEKQLPAIIKQEYKKH